MNLTFLNKTDKALHAMRDDQTKDGGEARREIKRRQLVGFFRWHIIYDSESHS